MKHPQLKDYIFIIILVLVVIGMVKLQVSAAAYRNGKIRQEGYDAGYYDGYWKAQAQRGIY